MNRFSLPSFVIRGFLSSEHGGRRAKPLFSIVWYSLQTVQELYCYAIGLCFVADLLIHEIRVHLLNEARPHPARRGFPPRSAGGGPVFPQKAAASFQNLQVVNNFLDRCFPMLYLSESRFQNWTRKWLRSDMHGCRRGTRIWPARSPSCRPPAAATFSKRRSRARRLTGPSWPR